MHTRKNTDYTYRNHCWIFRDFLGRNKLLLPRYNTQKIAVYYIRLGNKSPSAHLKRILTLAALKSIRGTISLYQAHLQKLRHIDSQWEAGSQYGYRQRDMFRPLSWLSQKILSPILQVWNWSRVKHEGSCQLKRWYFLGEWDIYRDCTGHSMG